MSIEVRLTENNPVKARFGGFKHLDNCYMIASREAFPLCTLGA